MKIKTRILISTLATALVTSMTLILVVYLFMYQSLQRQEVHDLHEHVNQAVRNLEEHIQVPAFQLKTLAGKELIRKDEDDSLSEELTEFNNVVVEFYSVCYTDLNGRVLASSDRRLIGKNILRLVPNIQDEFQACLKERSREVVISDIQKIPVHEIYASDSADMQMLTGVYNVQGKIKGILVALYDIGYLAHHVRNIAGYFGGEGQSFLIDSSGKVLITTDPSVRVMEPFKGMGLSKLRNDFETESNGFTVYTNKKGVKKLSGFVNLNKIGNHDLHWSLLVEVPYSEFLSPVHKLLIRLLYIVAFFLLLIIFLAVLFSRNLTKPLTWLTQATENLGEGRYEKLDFNSKSELGELVNAYNGAVEKIKNTTQELKENEELFRNLAESTTAGIAIIQDSKIVYCNGAILQMFGYTFDELAEKDFWTLVDPEYRETVKNYGLSRQRGEDVPSHYEFKSRKKTGEELWITLAAGSLMWKGKRAGIATLLDLTEHKKAAEKLRSDEQRLRMAQHIGRMGFLDMDLLTRKVEVASEGLEILGLAPDKNVFDFDDLKQLIHPEDQQRVMQAIEEALNGRSRLDMQHRLITANGKEKYVWSTAELIRDEKGAPVRLLGTIQDISESKQTEASLKLFRALIDNTYDPIEVADVETGRFVDVNERACEVLGYTRQEFLKLYVFDIDPKVSPKVFGKIRQNARKNGEAVWETLHLRKDGSTFPVEVNIKLVKLDREYLVSISRDITERKINEQKLIEAKEQAEESERLKSAFLANMSHEIRTPMNGILGFAELLKEPKLTRKEQEKYLSIIEKSGERMLNTVNDIIDISKIESGQMTVSISETNINKQMEFVQHFFKPEVERKGLKILLNTGLPSAESVVNTDEEKFYRILTNLVKNAIKFTIKGSIELGYSLKDHHLEFFVKDTGTGIPKAQFDAVFHRFVQGSTSLSRNYEGSGLGLTISKAYVEMLGGRIWLESQTGDKGSENHSGTTFYFTLPYRQGENGESSPHEVLDKTLLPDRKLKIMVVEDDEISAQLLKELLLPFSINFVICHGGKDAVEACRKDPGMDLIFMDVKMPDLDGYEATRQIRKFNTEVIIIAQTAFALVHEKEKALEAGCNDFITKPVRAESVREMLKKYFG